MKSLILLFCIFLLPSAVLAQDSIDMDEKYYRMLKDSTENFIGQGCGNAGTTSENLYLISYLIRSKRFDLIAKLLDSKTPSSRYIAALALIHAEKKSMYKADSVTKSLLNSLRQDSAMIPFCFGCTVHYQVSVNSLLEKKNRDKGINYWIIDCFRKRSRGYD